MKRYCLALDLKDDPQLIAEYEDHHKKVWPEILKSIHDAGIIAMEIYRVGNRLFMIMDVETRYSPEAKQRADATNQDVQAWNQLMDTLQQALPFAEPGVNAGKWQQMECIYTLSAQP